MNLLLCSDFLLNHEMKNDFVAGDDKKPNEEGWEKSFQGWINI